MEEIKEKILDEIVSNALKDEKIINDFTSFIIRRCKYCDRIMVNDFMGLVFEFWSDKLPLSSTIIYKEKNESFRHCVLKITNEIDSKHLSLWSSIESIDKDDDVKDWNKQYMILDKKSFRKVKLDSFTSDE